ncbi:MAG: FkbM family methyltransferase [Bacteroidota bacterium]
MKGLINKTLAGTIGYTFTKYVPKQSKVFLQQKRLTKSNRPLIFDVGAFRGESAMAYHHYFEGNCDVYSFEPFSESYEQLKANTASHEHLRHFHLALGQHKGTAKLHVNNFAATNSFLPSAPEGIETWGKSTLETKQLLEVPMETIDNLVEEHGIAQIDILKMDTQGTEHLVMEGARRSIEQGKIRLIYTELIVMPIYTGQMPLDEILRMYREHGFELYSLYQSTDQDGRLKFMDGIFIYQN